jgi:hypothetical protein
MSAVVSSPDELVTLLEDAFVMRRPDDVAALFEPNAVLAVRVGEHVSEARGRPAIADIAGSIWARDATFIPDPNATILAGGRALLVGPTLIAVLHRGREKAWRLELGLMTPSANTSRGDTP